MLDRETPEPDERYEDEGPGADEAQADADRVEQDMREAMQAMRDERDEFEQRLLRTAADFQNYRRRAEQIVHTTREQQTMDMARSLVTVLDHFDRALAIDPEKSSVQDVLHGMTMVRDELLRALGQHGVQRLNVDAGEPFDPNRHEALMRQPSDEVESNHVIVQLQPGYEINGKTLRPVQVTVAE